MADDKKSGNKKPIVIKRVKKGGHGGHHGGAWKVAYADFVTAMMAFFLMMWLLNVTTKEQKAGLAEYFSTGSVMNSSGTGGGETILTGGHETIETTAGPQSLPFVGFDGSNQFPEVVGSREVLIKKEREMFDRARIALEEAMRSDPKLLELYDNLVISEAKHGLEIQLIDQLNQPIYSVGTSVLTPNGRRLTSLLAKLIVKMPQQIAIEGHTDAVPFVSAQGYSNWELSSDRALAFRRQMIAFGVPEDQIALVAGRSSTMPYVKNDPKAPQNRRISITLLSSYRDKALESFRERIRDD